MNMEKKILVMVTGSIAAYKSAYLVSKLVQNDFEVRVVLTKSAFQFVGAATFEGLTDSAVYSDTFESGKMMSHINLAKWADAAVVVPADANTINKFASGVADNLITSIFLAYDFRKPFLIAPAMNSRMYEHPATQNSLKKLTDWGITVLHTDEGVLACGDTGKGKLVNPDYIFDRIVFAISSKKSNRKRILITSGATKEKIDEIRFVTNLSTGKTGAEIADYFFLKGDDVTLLKSDGAISPSHGVNIINFNSFSDLKGKIKTEVTSKNYDAVIHLAAISDFSPSRVILGSGESKLPVKNKIPSSYDKMIIEFDKNEKIVNRIKSWSKGKVKLTAFKFLSEKEKKEKSEAIKTIFENSRADIVVYNNVEDRIEGVQKKFLIAKKDGDKFAAESAIDLAKVLSQLIREE